jgi:hypothetical protein
LFYLYLFYYFPPLLRHIILWMPSLSIHKLPFVSLFEYSYYFTRLTSSWIPLSLCFSSAKHTLVGLLVIFISLSNNRCSYRKFGFSTENLLTWWYFEKTRENTLIHTSQWVMRLLRYARTLLICLTLLIRINWITGRYVPSLFFANNFTNE